jgi:hypothetical protein
MFIRNFGNYMPVYTADHHHCPENFGSRFIHTSNSLSLIQLVDMSFFTAIWHGDTQTAFSFSLEGHVF